MKKLLLLSALLIFCCSSDDSSDNDETNQTFLERYDGVVWEEEWDIGTYRMMITNPLTYTSSFFNESNVMLECFIAPYPEIYYIDTINRLEIWPDGPSVDNWNAWEVSESGNIMTRSDSNGQINYLIRTTLTDPCNP